MAQLPRDKPASEIKLLRVELMPKGISPVEEVCSDWSPAQPTESLDPTTASLKLKLTPQAMASEVELRYRKIQERFPPQVHSEMHFELRPCYELLSNPTARLNWYWSSGLIPEPVLFNEVTIVQVSPIEIETFDAHFCFAAEEMFL
jgi:hypothetical protein